MYEKISKGSTLVLVEGQKNGREGLKIEKPIVMYNDDGTMTNDYALLQTEVR